ncbi:uncharacterized protein B0I36DRAFT_247211 [Microdochium trichocladiopsis]|uniref:Hemerythrin-like domain-containing protein n=1 Tax=Microdochium trichocladiopsis TaxID=1682393 RepID=A0A9P8Y2L0_9PEZI|nr:uncharacterized protein B0I36DRAFT_247211 [Microdochium trichocladiopsis]KAH7027299.1 hypothetical protein B0I36DRAFT_247211 [Microdochium trichocladiopsis]
MFRRTIPRVVTTTRLSYTRTSRQRLLARQHVSLLHQTTRFYGKAPGSKYSFSEEQANLGGPSTPFKLSTALEQDYDQVKIFYQGTTAAPTLDERRGFQNALVWELARHIVAKELVVFPAVEDVVVVAGGKELIEKERNAHREIKELLSVFQDMKPDDDQFKAKLDQLYNKFWDTVKDIEQETLQKLESTISLTSSKELCLKYARTKNFAPTRSHPNAPDKSPFFETASALFTAPLDKLRDIFRRFPKDGDGPDGGHDGDSMSAGPKGAPYELHKKTPEQRSCP